MDGWVNEHVDKQMKKWIPECMNNEINRWIYKQINDLLSICCAGTMLFGLWIFMFNECSFKLQNSPTVFSLLADLGVKVMIPIIVG